MEQNIQKIVVFRLRGKFAHFRKFYTNASSLSYLIPPRTTLMGMIASVLEIQRDKYYDFFNDNGLQISVSIPEKLTIRKQTQSINNLHKEYYKLLATGKGKCQHSQCKLELLIFPTSGEIIYDVFLGGSSDNEKLNEFEDKLRNKDFGYGLYFGQRQFKAFAEITTVYQENEIEFKAESNLIDSICNEENFVDCDFESGIDILNEQMPHHFRMTEKKGKNSREPICVKRIYFERRGNRLSGKFLNCYKIGDKIISFY